jgi:hypothetical protein
VKILALQRVCDKIIKKNIIWKFTGLIFLVSLLFSIYANAETNVSEEHAENFSLPDYGPETFEKAANLSGFVVAKGTMPVITDESEKTEWLDLLVQCIRANDKIINYYGASGGPVLSFGTNIYGYLSVELDSASLEKVNDSVIDEIYQTIDEAAEEEGVSDIPVVFMWGERAQAEVHEDEDYIDNNEYIESIDNKNSHDENDIAQTTSGFTSAMLVLCILILTQFRK